MFLKLSFLYEIVYERTSKILSIIEVCWVWSGYCYWLTTALESKKVKMRHLTLLLNQPWGLECSHLPEVLLRLIGDNLANVWHGIYLLLTSSKMVNKVLNKLLNILAGFTDGY